METNNLQPVNLKKKGPSYIASIILYVITIGTIYLYQCGWGGGVICSTIVPGLMWMGIGLVVILFLNVFLRKTWLDKIYWLLYVVFILVILGWMVINQLPREAENYVVSGLTTHACETGKPAFPWGKVPDSKDGCFFAIGECFKMSKYDKSCFEQTRGKLTVINQDQCNVFMEGKEGCVNDVLIQR